MRKKLLLIVSAVFCAVFFAFGLAACGLNHNGNKPPKPPVGMLSPRIISFGSFLSWDEVEEADVYEIYCDGTLETVCDKPFYRIGDLPKDSDYCVAAKNSSTGEKTDKSNTVKVSKNCNFTDGEILNLTGRDYYAGKITAETRKVIIGSKNKTVFALDVFLAERTADIVFELKNVDVTGYVMTDDYSYKRAENDYNVIFDVTGDCSINGENGSDGFDYSSSVYDNMEIDAGKGEDGGSVIILSSVVVRGSGNLNFSGGNGGNGGRGSATTKWESKNGPGAGADGGNGGTAVKCAYLVTDFDSENFCVGIKDGVGGKKGKPGENGSIITGPMASAMWKDMYDIGKAGKNGKSVIGSKKIIKGSVV